MLDGNDEGELRHAGSLLAVRLSVRDLLGALVGPHQQGPLHLPGSGVVHLAAVHLVLLRCVPGPGGPRQSGLQAQTRECPVYEEDRSEPIVYRGHQCVHSPRNVPRPGQPFDSSPHGQLDVPQSGNWDLLLNRIHRDPHPAAIGEADQHPQGYDRAGHILGNDGG